MPGVVAPTVANVSATKKVVAILALESPVPGVGAVGVPVKDGLSMFAFRSMPRLAWAPGTSDAVSYTHLTLPTIYSV